MVKYVKRIYPRGIDSFIRRGYRGSFRVRNMAYGRRTRRYGRSGGGARRTSYRKTTVTTTRPRRRAAKRVSQSLPNKMTGTGQGDKYVLSQADPFDENVDGVKIPDANAQPSVPLKAEDTKDMAIGATHTSNCYAFNPTLVQQQVSAVPAGTDSWTWAAAFGQSTNSSKLTQLRSDFEMWRPVAHAIRITSALAPTAAKGFLHVCVFSQALYNQSTWAYPTSVSLMQNVPGYKRIPIGRLTSEGLTVVNRPLDVTSQRYVDTDADTYGNAGQMEFHTGLQWCSIIIAITGADLSTVPVSVEQIIHCECIPRATSISQATPAAKYNVKAQMAASSAQAKTPPTALDSERLQRKSSAINTALNAIGFGGKSKSFGMRISDLLRSSKQRVSDGIRNYVPSANEGM